VKDVRCRINFSSV